MSQADVDKRLLAIVRESVDLATIAASVLTEAAQGPVFVFGLADGERFAPGLTDAISSIPGIHLTDFPEITAGRVAVFEFAVRPALMPERPELKKLLAPGVSIAWKLPLQEEIGRIVGEAVPRLIEPDQKLSRPIAISNVIVTGLNNVASFETMLRSYVAFTPAESDVETIVVVNGSTDASAARASEILSEGGYRFKILQTGTNVGIAGGFNEGMRVAEGTYTCVLQDDVLFTQRNWHRELAGILDAHPRIGQIGGFRGSLYFRKQRTSPTDSPCFDVGGPINGPCSWERLKDEVVRVDAVNCMCAMHRRQLGFYDERYLPNGLEDIVFSFSLREAGYEVWVTDVGIHHGLDSATRGCVTPGKVPLPPAHRLMSRPYHYDLFEREYGHLLRPTESNAQGRRLRLADVEHELPSFPRSGRKETVRAEKEVSE